MRGHIKSVDKTVPQILKHPRLGHSVKPPIVRDRIVQLFGDVSRLELFARQKTDGWDAIGYGIDGVSVQEKIEFIKNLPETQRICVPSKEIIRPKPNKLFVLQ